MADTENGSLKELFSEMVKAADAPTGAQDPETRRALMDLADATRDQIKAVDKAARSGKISEEQQQAATKALQRNLAELQESVKLAATTQKDATKAIEESSKIAKDNIRLQKQALAQGRNLMKVQRQRVGYQGMGAGRISYFGGMPARGMGKAGRFLGGFAKDEAMGAAQGLAGRSALGGRLALAGPAGLAAGALIGVIMAAMDKRFQNLEASMLRTSNYGFSAGGGAEQEAVATGEALGRAQMSSVKFNQDKQAMQSAVQRIAATGVAWSDIDEGITDNIGRLAQLGVDTVDGLTEAAIQRTRDTGVTIGKAMRDIARESDLALGSGIEYGTFTHAMSEIENSLKTLNRSTGGLSKTFTKNATIAQKLGLSYNRMVNAGTGLTQKAMTFDEGFTIQRTDKDLALAIADAQKRVALNPDDKDAQNMLRDASSLQQQLSGGQIDRQTAAKFLNEIGVGKTQAVLDDRLGELADLLTNGGVGGVVQANARLGQELTFDEVAVLRKWRSGEALSSRDQATMDAIKEAQRKTAAATKSPTLTIEAYFEKLLNMVSDVLIPAIEAISDGIEFLQDTFATIKNKGFSGWWDGPSDEERIIEQTRTNAKNGLGRNLDSLLNPGEQYDSPMEKVRALQYDDRLANLRIDSAAQRRALEQFIDPDTAAVLTRATKLEKTTGTKEQVEAAKAEAAKLRNVVAGAASRVGADGSIHLTIPASALQDSAAVFGAQAASTNPVGS